MIFYTKERNWERLFMINRELNEKICNLRKKLDDSISNKEDYAKIYKMSVQLDNLINEYYREVKRRKQNNDSKNAY